MHQSLYYGPVAADERGQLVTLLGTALHTPFEYIQHWIARVGPENFRAVRLNGRIAAGLGFIKMGQWFGGARVPAVGITAVGVSAEQRSTGLGAALMHSMLEEMQASGIPLSVLYPATVPFYQRTGYERAGHRFGYELALLGLEPDERTLELVRVNEEPFDEFYRAYEQQAQHSAGNVDRPRVLWQRKLDPGQQPCFRYLVQRDGQTEGYIIYTQGSDNEPLKVHDMCILTPEAGRRLLTLFAGFRSQLHSVSWHGGLLDPLVYLLNAGLAGGTNFAGKRIYITHAIDWMLRIVDVSAALAARGYPPGVQTELHFAVRDGLLPINNGRFVLHVAQGKAEVQRGGKGRIRLDVRDLAALYSGCMTPVERCAIGSIDAPADDLALAASVFAGPRPWMADMF